MHSIDFVFVFPRTSRYCSYTINDNEEIHTKKYEEMQKFLINLCSPLSMQINEKLSKFEYFILDVQNKKIIPLSFNYEEELMKFKKQRLSFNLNKIMREQQYKQHIKNQKNFLKNLAKKPLSFFKKDFFKSN